MAEIIWSPQSINDLEDIGNFIAKDSLRYAQSTVENILNQVELLKQFPQFGRVVPEMGIETIREIRYKAYRIIYQLTDNRIEILTVVHSSRLLEGE